MYKRLDIIKSDDHLLDLIKNKKQYFIQQSVKEDVYDSIICKSHIIIGTYQGEDVYGYVDEKGIYPRKGFRHLDIEYEYFVRIWIMANVKIELKQPPKEAYDER